MVGVKNACFRFVNDFPPAIEDALGNPQVFKDSKVFGKVCCLPHTAPDSGVHVRKMIKTVSQTVAPSGIFHYALCSVQCVESVLALERRSLFLHLTPVHCAYG